MTTRPRPTAQERAGRAQRSGRVPRRAAGVQREARAAAAPAGAGALDAIVLEREDVEAIPLPRCCSCGIKARRWDAAELLDGRVLCLTCLGEIVG